MTLAQNLIDITVIVDTLITSMISVMSIFMEPPLSIYLGAVILGILIILIEQSYRYMQGKKYTQSVKAYTLRRDIAIKHHWITEKQSKLAHQRNVGAISSAYYLKKYKKYGKEIEELKK